MKIGSIFAVTIATAGLIALAAPAHAQRRGGNAGGGQGVSHGGGGRPSAGVNQGGSRPGFNRGGGNVRGGFANGGNRFHRGGRGGVNFYFGGYPYYGYGYGYGYGYPYFYGYPYYGYGYGYGYSSVAYSYDPQGVYNGRVVPRGGQRNTEERDPKDQSSLESQVQEQLAQAGYYRGRIDGVVGEGTRQAIRSYERANGLRVDGRIDNELLSTMGLG